MENFKIETSTAKYEPKCQYFMWVKAKGNCSVNGDITMINFDKCFGMSGNKLHFIIKA